MNRNSMLIVIFSLAMLLIVLYISKSRLKDTLSINQANLEIVKVEAIELDNLRKKWEAKSSTTIINQIKSPKLTRDERSSKKHILVFESLNPNELNSITNKILNANIKISNFKVNRVSDTNSSLQLEVEI